MAVIQTCLNTQTKDFSVRLLCCFVHIGFLFKLFSTTFYSCVELQPVTCFSCSALLSFYEVNFLICPCVNTVLSFKC